jgi:hypothetical protein
MKRLPLLALAVGFAACSPSIPTGTDNSSKYVVAEFDPAHSIIPLPNDLVFVDANGNPDVRLHAPETGGTDAQNEFNRDYLNLLDGFPMESTASVLFDKPIDETSIVLYPAAGANLAVFDVTAGIPVSAANISVSPAANGGQSLNIAPKSGYWTRGHQYAVLVLGGDNGVKGKASGQTVTGSETWGLLVSSEPLVTCTPADSNNCVLATSAIPTTQKDPAAAYAEQVKTAKQLEFLRKNYSVILQGATAQIKGLKATDIAITWTFTITSQAEVAFNPPGVIPFPNDILNPTGSQVSIPAGSGLPPDLVAGLNTLDGFSTTAPIITENGTDTGPLIQGKVKESTLGLGITAPINIVAAGAGKGAAPTTANGAIKAHVCLNCPPIVMTETDGGAILPILLPDGGVKPDTLAIVPDVPLTERTQYAVYVTTDLQDTLSKNVIPAPAFALTRSSAPLYDGTHSTVSILGDSDAQQLEQLRLGLKPLFDTLAAQGLPRKKVALAWAFTTQSTMSALSQLHAAPTSAGLPTAPTYVTGAYSANIKTALAGQGIPTTHIGTIYLGGMVDLFALTSAAGTFNPNLAGATPKVIPFVMVTPTSGPPANGYPVTIFGHGLTGNRTNAYAIADGLAAAGQVTIAIDAPWHGERNTCTGFGAYLTLATGAPAGTFTDDAACVSGGTCTSGRCTKAGGQACVPNDPGANGDALCQALSQGNCTPGGTCEGSTFAASAAGGAVPVSGWNLLNLANFFASRDNFRQQVISLSQLGRVIGATGNTTLEGRSVALDATKISYLGQSLGSFLGSLYTAVAPEIGNTALNVAGSDWELNLLTSPSFVPLKNGFIAGLAQEGVPQNSPTYDLFLGIAKWIIDPADPVNAAYYLTHSAGLPAPLPPNINPSTRRAFVQWILGDQTVVNPSTVELVRAATGDATTNGVKVATTGDAPFWSYQFNGSSTPFSFNTSALPECSDPSNHPGNRHPFLLRPPSATCGGAPDLTDGLQLTTDAQTQVAGFLSGLAPF